MSLARKCDRCGKYYDGVICHITVESRNPEFTDDYYDLCRECKSEFEEFMKGVKPKNLLERILSAVDRKKALKDCYQTSYYAMLNEKRREETGSKG